MIYKNKVSYGVCTNYYTVMFWPPQHTQCPEALPTNPLALFHQPPLFSQACNLQETRINVEYSSARAGDQFGEGMVTCAGLLLTSQHLWNSIVSKLEACCTPLTLLKRGGPGVEAILSSFRLRCISGPLQARTQSLETTVYTRTMITW